MKLLNPPRLKEGEWIHKEISGVKYFAKVICITGTRILCDPWEGDWVVDSDGYFEWEGEYKREWPKPIRLGGGLWEQLRSTQIKYNITMANLSSAVREMFYGKSDNT